MKLFERLVWADWNWNDVHASRLNPAEAIRPGLPKRIYRAMVVDHLNRRFGQKCRIFRVNE
jgi:hypothetical protein